MVFLPVYDEIWDFLEKEGILNDVIAEAENVFGKNVKQYEGSELYADTILEYCLFNYFHKNRLLIEYLSGRFFDSLGSDLKEQFELLKKSERRNLSFMQKIIREGETDTKGKQFYDFYFRDADTGETKIISSASDLEKTPEANMRLIRNTGYNEERYNVIGLIFPKENLEIFRKMIFMSRLKRNIELSEKRMGFLIEQSGKLGFSEIDSFKDENSAFIEQDRKIMKLNKMFYEKFKINISDFLNRALELSNNAGGFREMCEYYFSLSKEFESAVYGTNYIGGMKFFSYNSLLKALLGLALEDFSLLEKGIEEMREEARDEFESARKNALVMTREKIMENQKKLVSESPEGLVRQPKVSEKSGAEKHADFLKELEGIEQENISLFLEKLSGFLREKMSNAQDSEEKETLEFNLTFIEMLKKNPEKIPYIEDAKKRQEDAVFEPEKFYDYFYSSAGEIYELMKVMQAAHLFRKNERGKAYGLIKELNVEKNDCFAEMFFIGKVLSFFGNKDYRKYFNQAKRIDEARYKKCLEKFLAIAT